MTLVHLNRYLKLFVGLLGLAYGVLAAAQAKAPLLPPSSGIWEAGAGFEFALKEKKALKTRRSLSGIACNSVATGERMCLAVFDEGLQARYVTLRNSQLIPHSQPVPLMDGDGELDAEGAAADGRYAYVTGSHSAKRSDCTSNPDSRHVLRLTLDPATGRTLPGVQDDAGRLWRLMQTVPALKPYVGERKCLGSEPDQLGINIEGLAVRGERLYFGLRGPVIDGAAMVLSVEMQALFDSGQAKPAVTRLALGGNRGIRDLVAVQDGFLLLAGPDDGKANQGISWTLSLWDGKTSSSVVTPKLLANLDLSKVALRACDDELKPEALTVLQESPQHYQVLVLSDGMCDGGALPFTVPR